MTKAKHRVDDSATDPIAPKDEHLGDEASQPTELEIKVAELSLQAEEARNQMLRAVADYQNLRRRSEQEKSEIRKFANEMLVRDLLPVLDSFERAFSSVSEDAEHNAIVEGFRAIERQLRAVLEGANVRKMATLGESFDPDRHDALIREEHPELPEGTVSGEIEPGYTMGDRVIRPARVKVVGKT